MPTITIPQQVSPDTNLIAIPSSTYEEFLSWQKMVKSKKTFKATAQDTRDLAAARKNYAKGNYITLDILYHDLAARH
ncbi:hypothetical protein HY065_02655 [Candidatus Berkelbacteria bacterium]|nr:hypothetical protein [Candidatus Berkelbacteria bacterium]